MATNFITGFCRIRRGEIRTHFGQVPASGGNLQEILEKVYVSMKLDYPRFYKMDTLSKLGILAAELIVGNKDLKSQYSPKEVAVVLANRNASLDTDLAFNKSISTMASPSLFVYTLPNIVIGEICIHQGWKGENAFFVQESFDADFQTEYVELLLQKAGVSACLAGWIDVLGEDHDVFLYLAEKVDRGDSVAYSKEELLKLYTTNYGSIDGRSESSDH